MIQEIPGNLLDTDCKLIAHGVNCQGVMGSGVARAIYEKYPDVREKYMEAFKNVPEYFYEQKLGQVQYVFVDGGKIIANCFTQQNYGNSDQLYLSYGALSICIQNLVDVMTKLGINEIAIPKIGCGLAGGDWNLVREALEQHVPNHMTIKVYYL